MRRTFILALGFLLIVSGIAWSQQYNTSGGWYGSDTRRSSSTTDHLGLGVRGDEPANDRFQIRADGLMSWGSGSAVPDVDLARTAAGVLGLPSGDRFNAPLFGDAAGDDTLNIGGTDDTVTFDSNDSSGTYNCTDADANANCSFAGGGTGTATLGVSTNTAAILVTDGASVNVEGTTAETLTLTATSTNAAIFQGADAGGAADTTLDTTGAGSIVIGSADVLAVTITTDDTGDGTDLVLPDNGVGADELNGADVCGTLLYASVDPTEASATDDFMSMWDHAGSTTEGNEDEFLANAHLLTFHSLSCVVATAPGAGQDPWIVTIRDDGGDTAVTCTIDEAATTCDDSANSAAVAAGSAVNFDISSAGGDADPTANALITCTVCMGP